MALLVAPVIVRNTFLEFGEDDSPGCLVKHSTIPDRAKRQMDQDDDSDEPGDEPSRATNIQALVDWYENSRVWDRQDRREDVNENYFGEDCLPCPPGGENNAADDAAAAAAAAGFVSQPWTVLSSKLKERNKSAVSPVFPIYFGTFPLVLPAASPEMPSSTPTKKDRGSEDAWHYQTKKQPDSENTCRYNVKPEEWLIEDMLTSWIDCAGPWHSPQDGPSMLLMPSYVSPLHLMPSDVSPPHWSPAGDSSPSGSNSGSVNSGSPEPATVEDPASRKKKNRRRGAKKQGRGHTSWPQNSDRRDSMAAGTQATNDGSRFGTDLHRNSPQLANCKHNQLKAEADESQSNELIEHLQRAIKLFALDVRNCSVVQAILKFLDAADEPTRNELIEEVLPAIKLLALDVEGSRVVQAMLVSLNSSHPLMSQIVEALVDIFRELYESPNGNYVLQACVSNVPSDGLVGMIRKVESNAVTVARHVFGCRVLERFFEHFSATELYSVMLELTADAYSLCRHPSGNFVIQHMLEYVRGSHERILRAMLIGGVPYLASHRTASHLVEKALDQCDIHGKHQIVEALLKGEGEESIVNVAKSRYGSYVIQHLESLSHENCSILVADVEVVKGVLLKEQTMLLSTDPGRRVAKCFGIAKDDEIDVGT